MRAMETGVNPMTSQGVETQQARAMPEPNKRANHPEPLSTSLAAYNYN
jgi:hypothetical protein